MLPYTATDLIATMKREYGLDEPSAHALLKASPNASPKPRRRIAGWMHTLITAVF